MWKLRIGTLITSGLLMLAVTPGAWAASSENAGNVWLGTDPPLACQNIVLWGSGLPDSAGTLTLRGSGSQTLDYSGAWSYSGPGRQVIATISVSQLVAQAGGDTGAPGFHLVLDVAQDSQTHTTFSFGCPGGALNAQVITTSHDGSLVTSVGGVTASRPRHPVTKKQLTPARPARHLKVRRRHSKAVRVAAPPFTG
jgi:hypothetical protein